MAFVTNSDIRSGLSWFNTKYKFVDYFEHNGNSYLFVGAESAGSKCYEWSGSTWVENSTWINFDVSPGASVIPTIFYYNDELYVIFGNYGYNTVKGYKWDDQNLIWITDSAIIAGLTWQYQTWPAVFFVGTDMYLIAGANSAGAMIGYKYNGTSWDENTDILIGLPAAVYRLEITEISGTLHLFHNGTASFNYNTTLHQWQPDSFTSGYYTGTPGKSTLFELNGNIYIIGGYASTSFLCYMFEPASNLDSITVEAYNSVYAKVKVNLTAPLDAGVTLELRAGILGTDLDDPANNVQLTQEDSTTYYWESDIIEGEFLVTRALENWSGGNLNTVNYGVEFYALPAMAATVINITDANNYHTFPSHNNNHGLVFYNGNLYGSARNLPSQGTYNLFKINAADYSINQQTTLYRNKKTPHRVCF